MNSQIDYEDGIEIRRRSWHTMTENSDIAAITANIVDVVGNNILPVSVLTHDLSKRDQQLHGICKYYYGNGELCQLSNYRFDQKHGQSISYSFNGNWQRHYTYHFDQLHGWKTRVTTINSGYSSLPANNITNVTEHTDDNRRTKTNLASYYFKGVDITLPMMTIGYAVSSAAAFLGCSWLATATGLPIPHGGLVFTLFLPLVVSQLDF